MKHALAKKAISFICLPAFVLSSFLPIYPQQARAQLAGGTGSIDTGPIAGAIIGCSGAEDAVNKMFNKLAAKAVLKKMRDFQKKAEEDKALSDSAMDGLTGAYDEDSSDSTNSYLSKVTEIETLMKKYL